MSSNSNLRFHHEYHYRRRKTQTCLQRLMGHDLMSALNHLENNFREAVINSYQLLQSKSKMELGLEITRKFYYALVREKDTLV